MRTGAPIHRIGFLLLIALVFSTGCSGFAVLYEEWDDEYYEEEYVYVVEPPVVIVEPPPVVIIHETIVVPREVKFKDRRAGNRRGERGKPQVKKRYKRRSDNAYRYPNSRADRSKRPVGKPSRRSTRK